MEQSQLNSITLPLDAI